MTKIKALLVLVFIIYCIGLHAQYYNNNSNKTDFGYRYSFFSTIYEGKDDNGYFAPGVSAELSYVLYEKLHVYSGLGYLYNPFERNVSKGILGHIIALRFSSQYFITDGFTFDAEYRLMFIENKHCSLSQKPYIGQPWLFAGLGFKSDTYFTDAYMFGKYILGLDANDLEKGISFSVEVGFGIDL